MHTLYLQKKNCPPFFHITSTIIANCANDSKTTFSFLSEITTDTGFKLTNNTVATISNASGISLSSCIFINSHHKNIVIDALSFYLKTVTCPFAPTYLAVHPICLSHFCICTPAEWNSNAFHSILKSFLLYKLHIHGVVHWQYSL